MAEIGAGLGTSFPAGIDTNTSLESSSTKARPAVPNDLTAAVIAVEAALGTNPQGTAADVKSRIGQEHNADGTHPALVHILYRGTLAALNAAYPPGTAGRYAEVTDNLRGLYKDTGTAWVSVTGYADVRDFVTGGAGTSGDPWTGWETTVGGLPANTHVHFNTGYYTQASIIVTKAGWTISGNGRQASRITSTFTGDAFQSTNPINSSTAVWLTIRNLAIINTSASNTGAGFADVGGTFISISGVEIRGFKYNVILDQSELVDIDLCDFQVPLTANVWLVNGPDHTVGANTGYTNRISITRSNFNNTAATGTQIVDDGGTDHSFTRNNFNAGVSALEAAGVTGLIFENNESEGHSGNPVFFRSTTKYGSAYIGPSSGVSIVGNSFSDASVAHLYFISATGGTITGNLFGQYTGQAILLGEGATSHVSGLSIFGNSKIVTGSGKTDAKFVDGQSAVLLQNDIRQETQTYVTASLTAGSVAVTPKTMENIIVGSVLYVINADGTNAESVTVTATTSTTFTATFASNKAANWLVYGVNSSFRRLHGGGTALVAGDIALSAGWGTTATVSAISGTDQRFRFTITSTGTGQGANPTATLTFKDGTWTTAPFAVCSRGGGSQPTVQFEVTTITATALTLTFMGTPIAAETYTASIIVMG